MDLKKVAVLGMLALALVVVVAPAGALFGPWGFGGPFGMGVPPVPPIPFMPFGCSFGAGLGLGGFGLGMAGFGLGLAGFGLGAGGCGFGW
jgi:hypothetical protein